jgi:3',5'-cyclic AMP phosphodiesterase CpdA
MNDRHLSGDGESGQALLHFWALGDLHYYAPEQWRAYHSRRLALLYRDLRALWQQEGTPAFCVSPGDIVETSALENYQLAKRELTALLGDLPFYPGIGNHELWPEREEEIEHIDQLIEDYTAFWNKPAHYYWTEGRVLCVMLDVVDYPEPRFSDETLAFLQTALAKHPAHIAVIFAHCPLYNTVLDRDPELHRDYHSLMPFFSLHNSEEARSILSRHGNGCLYISGHTHSGWQAPNLVVTEYGGRSPITHINLMSPWFTGFGKEPGRNEAHSEFEFHIDEPDLVVSFAFDIYPKKAIVRLRDHRAQRWMAQWEIPLS